MQDITLSIARYPLSSSVSMEDTIQVWTPNYVSMEDTILGRCNNRVNKLRDHRCQWKTQFLVVAMKATKILTGVPFLVSMEDTILGRCNG
jgi:hypothetical protein